MRASYNGKIETVEWLLGKGAKVNLKSKGHTALDFAKSQNHTEIQKLLKNPKMQIDKQNWFFKTKNDFSKSTNQSLESQTQPSKPQNQSPEIPHQPSNLKGREKIERLDFSSSE